MKKHFIYLGLIAAAAFTLTNCAKEFENPSQQPESAGIPFEITASTPDTKTANDGMNTKWVSGDQINLFHAVAGTTEYVNDAAFTVENAATGLFKGTLAGELTGDTYDWYAFYPYKSFIETPAAQTDGYTYIGSRSDGSQAQVGVDNKDHIAGANYPLYGKGLSVAKEATPEITMSHASALIEVKVTNTLDTELVVENVSFTATESVVGTFYPNIVGDVVAFTDGPYVSEVANLSVSNATIAAGATASFYLAVKPFTAVSGSELILAVNGDDKPLTMTKDVTFSAGKIKTLTFAFDSTEEPEGPEKLSIAEFCELPDGSTIYEVTGTITGIYEAYNSQYNNISFYLKDDTGEMVVYRMSCVGIDKPAATITSGDQITVQGPKGNYNGVAQMAAGGKCVSHIDASDFPVITCVDNVVTITAEDGATIYYTINGDEPTESSTIYTDPFEIETAVTVKAIAVADGKVKSAVVTADLDPNAVPVETAELSFANKEQRTAFSTSQQIWEQNGIVVTNDKASSTSNVADYADPARFYKNSKLTVSMEGKSITKIEFVCNSSSYATALKNSIAVDSSVVDASVTVEFDTPVESFVVNSLTGGQVRMNSLKVTYLK